jgi:predicted RNA-binding protein with PUA-like domain
VASKPYPDPTQFDPKSEYYDPASRAEAPRWLMVDVHVLRKTRPLGLAELRAHRELADMRVLQKGNRLSITPVAPAEWRAIRRLLDSGD